MSNAYPRRTALNSKLRAKKLTDEERASIKMYNEHRGAIASGKNHDNPDCPFCYRKTK